jgi:hypothetical protein
MAIGLDYYERTEEFIGVSVRNPAVIADVAKAMDYVVAKYKGHYGSVPWDDSIMVRADEDNIYFEFRGTTGGRSVDGSD